MEVKDLLNAISYYKRENGKAPLIIQIGPKDFHDLAADKEIHKHLELFGDESRIIGHKFDGIPLIITMVIDKLEMT
jgi:hypothetical protein